MSYTQAEVQEMINGIGKVTAEQRGKIENRMDAMSKDYDDMRAQVEALETAYSRNGFTGGDGKMGTGNIKNAKAELASYMKSGMMPQASMTSSSDPGGGYTIPLELNKQILSVAKEQVTLRKLARVVTGGPDYRQVVCPNGPSTGWSGEMDTRSETTAPELAAMNFIFGELYANIGIYNHLLEDSFFDLGSWIVEKINESFATAENDVFLNGDGVGKPHGILQYIFEATSDATRDWGKLEYIPSGHATLLNNADVLIKTVYSLRPAYHKGAAFIMHPTTAEVVRKFKDGEGNYLWRVGLAEGQPASLLGFPVYLDEYAPAIAANAYPILFGNFNGYTVLDHQRGLAIIRDNISQKGLTSFYVSRRLAGAVVDFHAIKAVKIAAA